MIVERFTPEKPEDNLAFAGREQYLQILGTEDRRSDIVCLIHDLTGSDAVRFQVTPGGNTLVIFDMKLTVPEYNICRAVLKAYERGVYSV